jgi:hypothetical protein
MKNLSIVLIFSVLAVAYACKNDKAPAENTEKGPNAAMIDNPVTANLPTDTNQLARIVFEEPEFDFGTVKEGTIVDHVFKFTNTGKVPLTILDARSTCGCTVPNWSEEPIPPGGIGEISAKFNTDHKVNQQQKRITITANTYPNETRVLLKGTVTPKAD